MTALRSIAHRLGLRAAVKSVARAAGFDLISRNYYSPVPDLDALPADIWSQRSELAGIHLDVDRQFAFVRDVLGAAIGEASFPTERRGDRFHLGNGTYEGVDAEVLYAMIRTFRPKRIVELGSGASTILIAEARRRNEADGAQTTQVAYDPFPRDDLAGVLQRSADLRAVSASTLPLDAVSALEEGDILFVDTTHTVRLAGDVNRIVLDILPALRPGVIVHFHDIFLPSEYPVEFFTVLDVVWAEQYLLQAFLAYNTSFEILVANHEVHRHHGAQLRSLGCGAPDPVGPSGFWLRRIEGSP